MTRLRPGHRRMFALFAAFAAGLLLGAVGLDFRHQLADRLPGSDRAELVAGSFAWPTGVGAAWTISELAARGEFSVLMYNVGERAVTVVAARPHGWAPIENAQGATRVPAGAWARVPLIAWPDCAVSARPEIELTLRTDDGDREITIPAPGPFDLSIIHRDECQFPASLGLAVGAVGPIVDGTTLSMEISLRFPGIQDIDDVAVAPLIAESSGFRALAAHRSAPVRHADGTMAVEVEWTVDDCDLAAGMGEMPLNIEITAPERVAREHHVRLPADGVAALARFSAVVCASSG